MGWPCGGERLNLGEGAEQCLVALRAELVDWPLLALAGGAALVASQRGSVENVSVSRRHG